jgi:hypothetical protein
MGWLVALGLMLAVAIIWWLVFRFCMRDPNVTNGLSSDPWNFPPGPGA